MQKVIVDTTTRGQLSTLDAPAELCDEAGQVLGRFTPAAVERAAYEWARTAFTDAELEMASQQKTRYTTAEVLEHLKSQ